MSGAFNEGAMNKIKVCSGFRPWLGEIDDKAVPCGHELRVVQRGASNVYFSQIRSSIYLPKWGSSTKRKIIEILDKNWDRLTSSRINGELSRERFEVIADMYNVNVEELLGAAYERLNAEVKNSSNHEINDSEEFYRRSEYEAVLSEAGGDNQDFSVKNISSGKYGEPVK